MTQPVSAAATLDIGSAPRHRDVKAVGNRAQEDVGSRSPHRQSRHLENATTRLSHAALREAEAPSLDADQREDARLLDEDGVKTSFAELVDAQQAKDVGRKDVTDAPAGQSAFADQSTHVLHNVVRQHFSGWQYATSIGNKEAPVEKTPFLPNRDARIDDVVSSDILDAGAPQNDADFSLETVKAETGFVGDAAAKLTEVHAPQKASPLHAHINPARVQSDIEASEALNAGGDDGEVVASMPVTVDGSDAQDSSEQHESSPRDNSDHSAVPLASARGSDAPPPGKSQEFVSLPGPQVHRALQGALAEVSPASSTQHAVLDVLDLQQQSSGARTIRTLDLALDPVSLGAVHIRLDLSSKSLNVEISAARADTALQLMQDRDALSRNLTDAGYDVSSLSVVAAPTAADGSQPSFSSPSQSHSSAGQAFSGARQDGRFGAGADGGQGQSWSDQSGDRHRQDDARRSQADAQDGTRASVRAALYV
jgi:hypothetical protein